jgi:hypothetical protein
VKIFNNPFSLLPPLVMLFVFGNICKTNCEAAQETPNFENLLKNWEEWFLRASTIEPLCVVVEKEGGTERSFGAIRSRYEHYQAKGYYAGYVDRELGSDAVSLGTRPHSAGFMQQLVQPNLVTFTRTNDSMDYFIINTQEELSEAQLITLSPPFLFAVLIEKSPSDFGLSSNTELDNLLVDEKTVYIEKRFSNPKVDSFGRKLNKIEVTFSKDANWLPIKIVREYRFGTGEVGTWISEYQDWRDWEGFLIPFIHECRLKSTNELVEKSTILSVRRCKLSEVKQRCQITFYGIRGRDESNYWSWFSITIIGIIGLVIVCGILIFLRKA